MIEIRGQTSITELVFNECIYLRYDTIEQMYPEKPYSYNWAILINEVHTFITDLQTIKLLESEYQKYIVQN